MRFAILGSFEVSDGERKVALGGFKQRATLAVLVLAPNRVVPVDQMVHQLWGEHPPRQATGSLQAYVSNLRRALEPDRAPREPPRILRSEAAGYRLAIDPAAVDAARFEHLAAAGRAHLREGQPRAARDALAESLGLWRGPALGEFRDEPFARIEAAGLEELRADALEGRVAADLALGEHGAVVAELQRLVTEEPLREQLWAHLMVALYRAGRQGDALAAYRQCRQTLDAELGLEPGPRLRALEADVLRQASSLDWTPVDTGGDGDASLPSGAASAPASLIYRDGAGRLHAYPLLPGSARIRVGREADAEIWLSWDSRVSRLHAELEGDGERWTVIDDGLSANGSQLNGERIEGTRALADGDELRFGDTLMTFRLHRHSSADPTFLGTVS